MVEGADERSLRACVALITRDAPVQRELMERAPHLKVIGKHGSGLDAIDVAAATERGIAVISTPGSNANSVAEYAFALMFAVAKRLIGAHAAAVADDRGFRNLHPTIELRDRVLGIVGLGSAGEALARMASGCGMRVIAFSPHAPDERFSRAGATRKETLASLIVEADVISLNVPLREGNHGMLGELEFAMMKPAAIVVNTARAELIDQPALVDALARNRIAGAGLDVFDPSPEAAGDRLLELDNVVLSPHAAGSSQEALLKAATLVTEGVIDVLSRRRPAYCANPAVLTRSLSTMEVP